MSNAKPKIKRFYENVAIGEQAGQHMVLLDGRPARAAPGKSLAAPTSALGEAVADEWRRQGDVIDQATMPLTTLLSAALSDASDADQTWAENIISFLKTDLVCYRADQPASLTERQDAIWGPYLDWMDTVFGVKLEKTTGVAAIAQPDASIDCIRQMLRGETGITLFALSRLTENTGSAVIALACWKGAFAPEAAFAAARLDEAFQEERWGSDAEATARTKNIKQQFDACLQFLRLLAD